MQSTFSLLAHALLEASYAGTASGNDCGKASSSHWDCGDCLVRLEDPSLHILFFPKSCVGNVCGKDWDVTSCLPCEAAVAAAAAAAELPLLPPLDAAAAAAAAATALPS